MIYQGLVKDGYLKEIPRTSLPGVDPGSGEVRYRSWQVEWHDAGHRFYEFDPAPEIQNKPLPDNVVELSGHLAVSEAAQPDAA